MRRRRRVRRKSEELAKNEELCRTSITSQRPRGCPPPPPGNIIDGGGEIRSPGQSQIQSEPPPQILITSDRWSNWLMTITSNHLMITSSVASETTSCDTVISRLTTRSLNFDVFVVKLYQFMCHILNNYNMTCYCNVVISQHWNVKLWNFCPMHHLHPWLCCEGHTATLCRRFVNKIVLMRKHPAMKMSKAMRMTTRFDGGVK